jgi:hypothetical protein
VILAAPCQLARSHGVMRPGLVGVKRVERLMRRAGLSGLIRRRRGRTTIRVQGGRTAPDLVERDFDFAILNACLRASPPSFYDRLLAARAEAYTEDETS